MLHEYSRMELLIGEEGLKRLKNARVAVFGIGGVGSYVAEALAESGLLLGGEPSGHIIFRKYGTTGDGILTALRVAEIVLESKCPLSCLTRGYTPLPRREKNVRTDRGAAVAACGQVGCAVARAEANGLRAVVRASGTEPVVRILVEGEEGLLDEAMNALESAVRDGAEAL